MRIEPVDVGTVAQRTLRGWHDAWRAAHLADHEPGPPPGWARFCGELRHDPWSGEVPRWWLARNGGDTAGWLSVALPRADNLHAAICVIGVTPERRRLGIGRELVRVAAEFARTAGRQVLIGECPDGAGAPAFCAAVGAEPGVRGIRRLLHLERLAGAALERLRAAASPHAGGYEFLRWTGPVPDDVAADVAAVLESMNDAPLDDLQYEDERWDVGRLRRSERSAVETGYRLTMLAARHVPTGQLAGLTRVAVVEDDPSWAQQWETVVVPAHRGHRLGLILKLEMIRHLRAAEPALATIETDNAASNPYMIAVNETLGFEPIDTLTAYQLRLD
jgi:ribosomal protein S18 acetylase RimI-like enzyme